MSEKSKELATLEPIDNQEGSTDFTRWIMIALLALAGIVVLGIIIAIILAAARNEGATATFSIIRDIFIIILAVQGILICVALIVLILQLTALINLLRNEVTPLIDEARQTMRTVSGTTQFMSKNVTEPVIRVASAVAGARAFMDEITGIRRNASGRKNGK